MPLYKIVNGRSKRTVGQLEVGSSKHGSHCGKVKTATAPYVWSIGKELATVSEWCHRKGMFVVQAETEAEKEEALAALRPQGKLALTQQGAEK